METIYQRKPVGACNENRVAGSQKAVAPASHLALLGGGHDKTLKGLELSAQQNEELVLFQSLVAVFTHEVANPLNGIFLTLEWLKMSLKREDVDIGRSIAAIDDTMQEIDRVRTLVNEFHDMGRPQNVKFQKADLEKTTREVLSCQYAAYRNLGIEVEVQFDNPLPAVVAQPNKIKQVVLNLCKNAVEAMPDGGELIVKGFGCGQMVVLEISDSGAGVQEGLDIFELFRSTKRGGGVGLFLVWQIITAHNGTISYSSMPAPDQRTTFKVSLPAVA